ncbi:RagB/SusD family nutrient uptake outer membrane protein [Compostibacter hankyongensis]|uniref:RagB/SusD family nutrient uptake outer membrane protein n=1 Tax=Compostibacter hankyongensis TaxID=1007089 RepID=A0ABP8FWD7_9BACT
MKKPATIIIASVLSCLAISCEKSVLDKNPQNEFSEKDVWGDINLAKTYLNTVYDGIGQWGMHHYRNPQVMANSATDEAMQRGDHGVWVLNKGNITSSNYGDFNMWTPDYKAIRRCNIFLQHIGDVPGISEEDLKLMKAQARFIRAINYADLLNWYCWWEGDHNGVPLITEPFELNDDFKVERADYSAVVDFVIKELDEILDDLPAGWDDQNWGRVTKGADLALKSEILLYAASKTHNPAMDPSKWKQAADAARAVIDLDQYSLKSVNSYEDYAKIFISSANNPEIILARPYDPVVLESNWVDLYNLPNGYGGWGGNCPTQQFVDQFQMDNGRDISDPSSGYDDQRPYTGRELRFYADIVYNGRKYRGREVEFWTPGGLDSKDGPTGWNVTPTGYTLYKFMNESIDFQVSPAPTPYVIFRLAEIYLNYAEAEYHLGNEEVAREFVNKIRTRVKLPGIRSSGNRLLQDIRHERTIELAFEKDSRWNDLRRWGILEQTASQDYIAMQISKDHEGNLSYQKVVAMKRGYNERLYSLPIPLEELQKASELNQNPGY